MKVFAIKIIKSLLTLGLVCAFLSGLAWVFRYRIAAQLLQPAHKSSKRIYLENNPEKNILRSLLRIQKDAALLAEYPIFEQPSRGIADSAILLNALVGWERSPQHQSKLSLSPALKEQLKGNSFLQPQLRLDWRKLALDFSWFAKLHKFDHWSFDLSGPAYELNKQYKTIEAPGPNYGELLDWAKLRFLLGRDLSDPESALKDVRQLARLAYTTDDMIGALIAVSILNIEREFYDSLSKESREKIKWTTVSKEATESARRFFYAQPSFVDARLTDKVYASLKFPVAGCLRMNEGIRFLISFRRIMQREQGTAYARFEQSIKESASHCRESFFRKMWRIPEYQGLFESDKHLFEQGQHVSVTNPSFSCLPKWMPNFSIADLENHPEVGVPLIYTLLAVGEPDFLRFYQQ